MNEKLTTIYNEFHRYIYHLCLKFTRNTSEAEDLMQEVWVKVVRYEDNLREGGPCESLANYDYNEHIPRPLSQKCTS